MKRMKGRVFLAAALAAATILSGTVSAMEEMGVVMIVGPGAEEEPLSMDDAKLGSSYDVSGYGTIVPQSFDIVNKMARWSDGKAGNATERTNKNSNVVYLEDPSDGSSHTYLKNASFVNSGEEAEYACFKVDILNRHKDEYDFAKNAVVTVVYNDEYVFQGGTRQFNYNYQNGELYQYGNKTAIGWPAYLGEADTKPVGMLYWGHYLFFCTLPNFVVEDKEGSLKIVVSLDENELTYIVRD